mmetsp:Transcript_102195/g.202882  ORF Transcript_102195/g.202882 Transcript_102195/m.202882 type:complete len:117 (+) Transcript_102195:274-624(+)
MQPTSDCNALDACPVSGGKGLCTKLCDSTCPHCTEKHEWNRCHMYVLTRHLPCRHGTEKPSVLLTAKGQELMSGFSDDHLLSPWKPFQSEGHLRDRQCMHDVANGRALDEELLCVH